MSELAKPMHINHTCTCRNCCPDMFPSGPKQGQNHIAIRFLDGDVWRTVTFNGEPARYVNEALAGENGYIIFYPSPKLPRGEFGRHICATCLPSAYDLPGETQPGYGACEAVAYGRVVLSSPGRPPWEQPLPPRESLGPCKVCGEPATYRSTDLYEATALGDGNVVWVAGQRALYCAGHADQVRRVMSGNRVLTEREYQLLAEQDL